MSRYYLSRRTCNITVSQDILDEARKRHTAPQHQELTVDEIRKSPVKTKCSIHATIVTVRTLQFHIFI